MAVSGPELRGFLRAEPGARLHKKMAHTGALMLRFRGGDRERSSTRRWQLRDSDSRPLSPRPYEGFIGLSSMTAFRYYRVRGDSVRWRRSDGPVRPALGYGLVLAIARDDHGPTAARLAL